MHELNEKLCVISRVVVHPKYRTMGLGTKLVKDTLALAGTECVEMAAVMAKYNPFAEKAGMRKIAEQPPPKEAVQVTKVLEQLGFNTQQLGSSTYILSKLKNLDEESIDVIKQEFIRNKHTRFLKSFSYHLPFGTKEAYEHAILSASLDKLAGLVRICGFLMQTKVYLFWRKDERSLTSLPQNRSNCRASCLQALHPRNPTQTYLDLVHDTFQRLHSTLLKEASY